MTDSELHIFASGGDSPQPRCVVVEGPECDDAASFFGAWLTAAGTAEAFWKRAYKEPDFIKQMDLMFVGYIPDFGMAACSFIMHLRKPHITSLVVRLESEDGDEFAMMAEMGFFVRVGNHYKMTIPSRLTLSTVKAAALAYAATESEDEDGPSLHPELLVATMSLAEAIARQARLQAIQEFKHVGYPGRYGAN